MNQNLTLKRLGKNTLLLLLIMGLFSAQVVYASTTGDLPFNSTTEKFSRNFLAWVATISVILWVVFCCMLAWGELTDGVKKLVTVLMFLSLALGGGATVQAIFGSGAVF